MPIELPARGTVETACAHADPPVPEATAIATIAPTSTYSARLIPLARARCCLLANTCFRTRESASAHPALSVRTPDANAMYSLLAKYCDTCSQQHFVWVEPQTLELR